MNKGITEKCTHCGRMFMSYPGTDLEQYACPMCVRKAEQTMREAEKLDQQQQYPDFPPPWRNRF